MSDTENDRRLARLLKDDPAKGLEMALRRFGLPVRAVCAAILGPGSAEEVEEAIADSFFALWREADRYDPEQPLSSWLYGIARRTALNHRRALGQGPVWEELPEGLAEEELDLTDRTAERENARLLRQAVEEMESPDREIFIRRYYLYQRVKEIAARLGLSEKAVENRLHRGKQKLRRKLLERGVIL